jgi:hypothetical protein
MAASVSSVEDICNIALRQLGYDRRIGNIWEGSKASKILLDIYAEARDALLREGDWGFAERNVTLTLLKQAPAYGYIPPTVWDPALYPPLPWQYEFAYPGDCLKVRALKLTPLFLPVMDPAPVVFRIVNDNAFVPAQKVIVTNAGPATVLTYTAQVTDMTTWEPNFVEALSGTLAKQAAPALAAMSQSQAEAAKLEGAEAGRETAIAAGTQG